MLKTPLLSLILVLAAALLGAVGQFVFQHAAKTSRGLASVLVSPWAWLGMLTYLSVMVLFTQAFRLGGNVKVLYPIYATTFIWAALGALALHGTPIRPIHMAGMTLLISGIVCMSW